jgi:hypothetical protein
MDYFGGIHGLLWWQFAKYATEAIFKKHKKKTEW